ncbi:winged helix-turn-helix domain-containing protein [Candidatus Woesearchaeota archaeon]|nr:winged helix-turn-helix domain-containing protein [Candidatus Woesearchaeota archaeon]
MRKGGVFCETYGLNIQNIVLEYLLENQGLDFAIGDLAKETKISRPKAYSVIKELEKKKYVNKSRVIGRTQLYKLDKNNKRVRLLIKDFKECLKLAYEEKKISMNQVKIGLAYAKS